MAHSKLVESKIDDTVERYHAAHTITPAQIIQRILKGDEVAAVIVQNPERFYPPEQALELIQQFKTFLVNLSKKEGPLSPYEQTWLGYYYGKYRLAYDDPTDDFLKAKQILESVSDNGKPLPLALYFLTEVYSALKNNDVDIDVSITDKVQKQAESSLAKFAIIRNKADTIIVNYVAVELSEQEELLLKETAEGNHPLALLSYGMYLKNYKSKDNEAIPFVRQAAFLGMPKALFELANLEKENSPEKYEAYLTAAAESYYSASVLIELGNVFIEKNQIIKAAYCFRAAAYSKDQGARGFVGGELESLTSRNNFVIKYLNASLFLRGDWNRFTYRDDLTELAASNPSLFYSCVRQEASLWQAADILIKAKAVKPFYLHHQNFFPIAIGAIQLSTSMHPNLARLILDYTCGLGQLTELCEKLQDKTPEDIASVEDFPAAKPKLLEAAKTQQDSKAMYQLYLGLGKTDQDASLYWLEQAARHGECMAIFRRACLLNHRQLPLHRVGRPATLLLGPDQATFDEFEKLKEFVKKFNESMSVTIAGLKLHEQKEVGSPLKDISFDFSDPTTAEVIAKKETILESLNTFIQQESIKLESPGLKSLQTSFQSLGYTVDRDHPLTLEQLDKAIKELYREQPKPSAAASP